MKKKYIAIFLVAVLFSVLLCACKSSQSSYYETTRSNDETSVAGRVVVHTYYGDVYTDNVNESATKIEQIVADFAGETTANDCYVRTSEERNDYAYYTIKIKGDKFNAFVARISEAGDIQYERTLTEDITDSSSAGKGNDLSTINIHIYLNGRNKLTFNDKLWNAVEVVWSTIVANAFAIIILILPFVVIIAGITVMVYFVVKRLKRKDKKEKKSE